MHYSSLICSGPFMYLDEDGGRRLSYLNTETNPNFKLPLWYLYCMLTWVRVTRVCYSNSTMSTTSRESYCSHRAGSSRLQTLNNTVSLFFIHCWCPTGMTTDFPGVFSLHLFHNFKGNLMILLWLLMSLQPLIAMPSLLI